MRDEHDRVDQAKHAMWLLYLVTTGTKFVVSHQAAWKGLSSAYTH